MSAPPNNSAAFAPQAVTLQGPAITVVKLSSRHFDDLLAAIHGPTRAAIWLCLPNTLRRRKGFYGFHGSQGGCFRAFQLRRDRKSQRPRARHVLADANRSSPSRDRDGRNRVFARSCKRAPPPPKPITCWRNISSRTLNFAATNGNATRSTRRRDKRRCGWASLSRAFSGSI